MQQIKIMMSWMLCVSLLGLGAAEALSHPRLRSQALKARHQGLSLDVDHDLDVSAHETGASKYGSLIELYKAVGGNVTTEAAPSLDTIESVLATLEAEKKAGKATPGMGKFVDVVTGMIDKEMIPEINFQHLTAKRILRNFEIQFASCGNIRKLAKAGIKSMALTKTSSSTNHMSCRKVEDKKFVVKEACLEVVAEKKKAMDNACGAFRDFKKDPTSEANNCHTTDVAEPYGLWLKRNRKQFQKKLTEYRRLKGLCDAATRAWKRVFVPCTKNVQAWDTTRGGCEKRQMALETATCSLAKKMKDTCDTYETCHEDTELMYQRQKPKIEVQEKDRKTEFRALMRIKCLLVSVFGGEEVDEGEIDKCKAKTHTTEHLDLKYPVVPDLKDCDKLPPIPGEKLFKKDEFDPLPINVKAKDPSECVLTPAGGVILGLQKKMRKDKCRLDNGWLQAQNGGSCLLAGNDGVPLKIDYTKRKFTKYRFTMKLDETNPENSQSEGGGFSICNLVGDGSFANGKDPSIAFIDGVKSMWGYHLFGGFKGVKNTKAATCKDLLVDYKVWGSDGKGIDVSKYTNSMLKWIGCMGDGCSADSFYCNDQEDGIEFGSPGTLRALLGDKIPDENSKKCCSATTKDGICNAMDKTKDIDRLCHQLGYTRGSVLEKRKTNYCPEVEWRQGSGKGADATTDGWGSDFVQSHGYGNKFRCQGATAKNLYTNKKYYDKATPKSGVGLEWDLTMQYKGGKYALKSLKIGGVDFSGYAGSISECPAVDKNYAFAPRIMASKTGKAWIKDFRVFQGNWLKPKKMRQVIGQGVGKAAVQKKLLLAAAKKAALSMPRCSVNGHPSTWVARNMLVDRTGTIFRKSPKIRRGWNAWAMLGDVTQVKYRIISRKYQHVRVGLTYYNKPHLHFPGGRAFGIYPGGRLLVEGCCWRRWRYGDSVAMKIEGSYYCAYHNSKKLRCWRLHHARLGKAFAQIHIHEAAEGVQLNQVCTAR